MTPFGRHLALALLIGMAGASVAHAQGFGTEDGYGGDGIGWGPAYRRDTTFRPAVGFYGGVERPNPYVPRPATTGSLGDPDAVRPRFLVRRSAKVRRPVSRPNRTAHSASSRIR